MSESVSKRKESLVAVPININDIISLRFMADKPANSSLSSSSLAMVSASFEGPDLLTFVLFLGLNPLPLDAAPTFFFRFTFLLASESSPSSLA